MANADVAPAPVHPTSHSDQLSTPDALHPEPIPRADESAPVAPASSSTLLPSTEQSAPPRDSPAPKDGIPAGTADDAQAAGAAYSTRSRNRGNAPRPNYSEDIEMDFERPLSRRGADLHARSASLEPASKADAEPTRGPATIKLHTRHQPQSDFTATNSSYTADKKSSSPSASDGKSEHKKRKLNRTSAGKPTSSLDDRNLVHAAPQESLSGPSQYLAVQGASTDAPLTKRRRTGDDANKASQLGPYPAADSCVVSFENTSATLRNGKLEADDGTLYARDGKFDQRDWWSPVT